MEAKDDEATDPPEVAEILIKKQCEHAGCPLHRCEREDLRIGGIDI